MAEETEKESQEQENEKTEQEEETKEESRTLTQEEINKLIESARKQEKDKLYETISSLRDQVSDLAKERKSEKEERERIEKEGQEKEESERLAKMSAEDKVSEQLKKLEERLANEANQREKLQVELETERTQAELERYKADLLRDEKDIIPELVGGTSKEEIQASVATARAKYQQYFEAAVSKAKGTPGRKVEGVPGPADPDPDPLDEKDLEGLKGLSRPEMTTGSMKSREEILANRNKGVNPEYMKQKDELLTKVGELYKKSTTG